MDTPSPFSELGEWLGDRGYAESSEPVSPSFGDRAVRFEREGVVVRLWSDRGDWYVDVGGFHWERSWDPDLWKAWLDDAEPTVDPATPERHAAVVRECLPRMERAIREDPRGVSAEPSLRLKGERRAHALFGIGRDPP